MAITEKAPPQPMLPHGFARRVFGFLMERFAASNYRWTVDQLLSAKPRTYLEIGFGTGRLAEMVAREIRPTILCAVDPSELMLKKATRRLKPFRRKMEGDLRLGDDRDLPWADRSFDAIVASHSFQFWSDPDTTLRKLSRLLTLQGRLILVIRSHRGISTATRAWIPNPITKSPDELAGLRQALADAGFRVVRDEKLRTGSQGIVAECA